MLQCFALPCHFLTDEGRGLWKLPSPAFSIRSILCCCNAVYKRSSCSGFGVASPPFARPSSAPFICAHSMQNVGADVVRPDNVTKIMRRHVLRKIFAEKQKALIIGFITLQVNYELQKWSRRYYPTLPYYSKIML